MKGRNEFIRGSSFISLCRSNKHEKCWGHEISSIFSRTSLFVGTKLFHDKLDLYSINSFFFSPSGEMENGGGMGGRRIHFSIYSNLKNNYLDY